MINSVGLIGVGRFGKVLANILKKGFNVKAHDIVSSKVSNDLIKSDLDDIFLNKKLNVNSSFLFDLNSIILFKPFELLNKHPIA